MLYVSFLVLLYNMLCHDKYLWVHTGSLFTNNLAINLIHSILILPMVVLIYLVNFPAKYAAKKMYILKWMVGSLIVEYVMVRLDLINFYNGYKFWMEVPFYLLMYAIIRLHHTRPLMSYIISTMIIIFLVYIFNIPLS